MTDDNDNDDRDDDRERDHETESDNTGDVGVPDSDPRHFDPSTEIANMVEDNIGDVELGDATEPDDLREFIDAAESGEMEITPTVEAQVRMSRALLEEIDDDVDEDPLQAVREAAGDAFEGQSIEDLREEAREQAKQDAEEGFERGKAAAEASDE